MPRPQDRANKPQGVSTARAGLGWMKRREDNSVQNQTAEWPGYTTTGEVESIVLSSHPPHTVDHAASGPEVLMRSRPGSNGVLLPVKR
jgi:hypothetical protein